MSHYPDGIDELIFFQDNNLETIESMKYYNVLTAQGRFTEANKYISKRNDVYGYFADLYNAIENRIYTLQDYLLKMPPKKKFFVFINDQTSEPDVSLLEENMIWS